MGRRPIHESATNSSVPFREPLLSFRFRTLRIGNVSYLHYVVDLLVDPRGTREAHEVGSDRRGGLYSTTAIDTWRAGATDVYFFDPATAFPPPQCGIAPLIRISTQQLFPLPSAESRH
jgi:hypothetical protein